MKRPLGTEILIFLTLALGTLLSCKGTETGNPLDQEEDDKDHAAQPVADRELPKVDPTNPPIATGSQFQHFHNSVIITSLIDDVVESLARGPAIAQDPLGSIDIPGFQYQRTCEELSSGAARSTVKSTGKIDVTIPVVLASIGLKLTEEALITNTWSKPQFSVRCHDQKSPDLPWQEMAGLRLETTSQRAHTRFFEFPTDSGEKPRNLNFTSAGTKHIAWQSGALATTDIEGIPVPVRRLQRTVYGTVNRVHTLVDDAQKAQTIEAQFDTPQENALVITEDYPIVPPRLWIHRTVTTGKVTAIQKDGTRITAHFENVKFGVLQGCLPLSGKIFGTVDIPGTSPTATTTFSLEFADKKAPLKIVFASGESHTFRPEGCDFQRF